MAALYKRNVAFKRALDAAAAQKKELQELEEMRECTFKPKIAKSFSARGGGSTRYDMDEDVKMPTRLRHLQVPSHKMFTAFKSPEPNKGERALDAQGGPLDGIAQAFEKLELDLNQRHFVVRALEKENKRLRYASAFARDDVPSAQQSLGGDFDFGLRNKSKTRNRRGRVQASGSSNSPNLRTRRHSRKDQREVGAFVAEDTEAEADMWQAEAEGIIENLSDYIRHSTTYVSSLLWEFDQLSYLMDADDTSGVTKATNNSGRHRKSTRSASRIGSRKLAFSDTDYDDSRTVYTSDSPVSRNSVRYF